jgi:tetratricopeptide (TPR) repeat protein
VIFGGTSVVGKEIGMSKSESRRPFKVFCSYARADEKLCEDLRKHLAPLERQGLLYSYDSRMIGVGIEKQKESDDLLDAADIILLLISANFFASDDCGSDMRRALDRHQRGDARVIPIIVRPVDWANAPFSSLQVLPTDGIPVAGRRDHDEAFADIAKEIRGVIEKLVNKPSRCLPRSPGVRKIPYRRNPLFTGRERTLQQIYEGFFVETTSALPQALCGLGGIGKTQVAIEYVYRYRDHYHSIFWARASTRDMLMLDCVAIAESLKIANKGEQDQEYVIAAVQQWLAENKEWLLIVDNVDEMALLNDFLPIEPDGHILLITQSQSVGTYIRKIQVEGMSIEEGEQFLLRRSRVLESEHVTNEILASAPSNARAIASSLGGLPLALDQAGAYIEETSCSIAAYLSRYRVHQEILLQRRGGGHFGGDHPEPVTTTWSLSFKRVEQANSSAAHLLKFCAFLSPDAIPEELLRVSEPECNLQPIVHDSLLLDEAIGVLLRFSLVKRDSDGNNNILSIHPLIQAALKGSMDDGEKYKWAKYAVIAVHSAFPEFSYEKRSRCQHYLPHAMMCSQHIAEYALVLSEAVQLLNRAGSYLYSHAVYDEADGLLLQALTMSEKVFGPEHPETANCLNKLAELSHMQFNLERAESFWKRALMIRENIVGADDPGTAEILDNLGVLYYVQAHYTQAEKLYARALEIREEHLGPEHKDTGQTLSNLGVLYHAQGKFEKAEALYQRAYAIAEKIFGSEHPFTANGLDCLARLYHDQGKFEQAEPLYQRALTIRKKEPGLKHPRMAHVLGYLGDLYYHQGRYDQAVVYSQQALAITETMFKPEHPNIAVYCSLLAKIYGAQSLYEDAEDLYQKAFSIMEKRLGTAHPLTVKCLNEFAVFYQKQGKCEQAASLYRKALSISDIPSNRSAVVTILKDYALFLRNVGEEENIEEIENQIRNVQNSLY